MAADGAAFIEDVPLTIESVTINPRRITLSIFKQLQVKSAVVSHGNGYTILPDAVLWGWIKYDDDWHLIFSDSGVLYRTAMISRENFSIDGIKFSEQDTGRLRDAPQLLMTV